MLRFLLLITKTIFMRFQFSVILPVVLLLSQSSFAQTQQKVTINHVTVFLSGAEINSSARVALKQGANEVLFTNIAGNIDEQSLSVGADNRVAIQSAVFRNNYLENENLSPLAKMLKDSIQHVEADRSSINNQLTVVNEQVNILSQNKQVSGANTGLSVAELQKMLDLVKARLGSLLNEKDELVTNIKKIDEQLTALRRQYEEEKMKFFQPGGQLLVTFYCPQAVTSDISISYVTANAGWTPVYDIKVEKLNDPVQLYYKANVYQNSGITWNNVKLSLSTGNPSMGSQAPVLAPWYLSFYTPYPMAKSYAPVMEDAQRLSAAGGRAAEMKDMEESALNNYVQVNNNGINTTFDIDIPYTILSDGKQHNISVKKYESPAIYSYYAAPKLDNDAFLQAKVTGWDALDLLPAATNVFYEGTFVGKGYLDMNTVEDTMNISLGRDKRIIIKREKDKELRSVRTIGSNVRETFNYTISIRNTKKEPVTITIADQVPVSNDKDIVVEDVSTKGAEYDETTGEVKWNITLAPNETGKLTFGYTVKYPKGKRINL